MLHEKFMKNFGTVAIQSSRFSYGMIRLMVSFGAGISFKVSSVMIPKVPSEPIIRFNRLYPVEVLETVAPSFTISPVGSTTVIALT